jgi:hypothetical protein
VKTTPVRNVVPLVVMAFDDSPGIRRTTDDGLQPAVSAYCTVNVKVVLVLPDPGVALPELRVVLWDASDAPLQLPAASTDETVMTRPPAMSASPNARPAPRATIRSTPNRRFTR